MCAHGSNRKTALKIRSNKKNNSHFYCSNNRHQIYLGISSLRCYFNHNKYYATGPRGILKIYFPCLTSTYVPHVMLCISTILLLLKHHVLSVRIHRRVQYLLLPTGNVPHKNRPTVQITTPRWVLPAYGSTTCVVPCNHVFCSSDYIILTTAVLGVTPKSINFGKAHF